MVLDLFFWALGILDIIISLKAFEWHSLATDKIFQYTLPCINVNVLNLDTFLYAPAFSNTHNMQSIWDE